MELVAILVDGEWVHPQPDLNGRWTPYSPTLPRWGSMRNGELFQRPKPEPRTDATESSSSRMLGTPQARDFKGESKEGFNSGNLWDTLRMGGMLEGDEELLRTPQANHSIRGRLRPERLNGPRHDLQDQLGALLPTPTPFTNENKETPDHWLQRRADVIERTGTYHGLPLAVCARSIDDGNPLLQSDPMGLRGQDTPASEGRFGPYEAAVRRWENILGVPAPHPTFLRDGKPRLSAQFVEWMLGLPPGHVTGTDVAWTRQLKLLGNSVVPQQALLALHLLDPVR
jgi:hypothetical protein